MLARIARREHHSQSGPCVPLGARVACARAFQTEPAAQGSPLVLRASVSPCEPVSSATSRAKIAGVPLRRAAIVAVVTVVLTACKGTPQQATQPVAAGPSPSILLITLDTTRADAIGPDAVGVSTPAFNAVAARGRRFRQAYTTVPETLPSHASMMTGLYPAGHGVHENARYLPAAFPVIAEKLQQAGYTTAAYVSSFALARRFGLARGFLVYDDEQPPGQAERGARETTDRAIAGLAGSAAAPRFVWVHYYDPHYPYEPPEPFRTQFARTPYLGEVMAMDREIGRLVAAFDEQASKDARPPAIVIVADHGEGLGDHGEALHGNLLYQSTMHVPLVIAGPGVQTGVSDAPVSTRRVFHTILDWAGLGPADSLRRTGDEIVLGEAMKPFLEYGWQPQIMAVAGPQKAILAGTIEAYEVLADPKELTNLGSGANLPAPMRAKLEEYPVPSVEAARAPENLDEEAKRRLASLGYVGATATPVVRKDAPKPADMTALFETIDRASGAFAAGRYSEAVPFLKAILARDPFNIDATLRLATAYSSLGQEALALQTFRKAAELAPRSQDVRTYLGLHYARGTDWARAVPLLEQVVAEAPDRLPPVEALAVIRERQGRIQEAVDLRRKVYAMRAPTGAELVHQGELAMAIEQTDVAIEAFESARANPGAVVRAQPRTRRALSRLAPAGGREDGLGPRDVGAPRLPDGALQAGPGQRPSQRARSERPHRRRPPARRRNDQAAHLA